MLAHLKIWLSTSPDLKWPNQRLCVVFDFLNISETQTGYKGLPWGAREDFKCPLSKSSFLFLSKMSKPFNSSPLKLFPSENMVMGAIWRYPNHLDSSLQSQSSNSSVLLKTLNSSAELSDQIF